MVSITVRDVPDAIRAELAARSGRSLQEYLRSELVRLAETPDFDEVLARVRRRKVATGVSPTTEDILEHRDADKR